MLLSIIGLGVVLFLVFLRMPIALAMGLVGFAGYADIRGVRASISMVGRIIIDTSQDYGPVSYTHLTLPTSDLV